MVIQTPGKEGWFWNIPLHDNIVFVASIPLLAWFWLDWVCRARAGHPPRALGRAASVAIVVVLGAFAFVRNLPGAEALRP